MEASAVGGVLLDTLETDVHVEACNNLFNHTFVLFYMKNIDEIKPANFSSY